MALALPVDVEADLGRALTEPESSRVVALLENASDLVEGYVGREFTPETAPGKVVRVVAKVAARTLTAPSEFLGLGEQSAGTFSVNVTPNASAGDVYLTASDKKALRFVRGGGGITSLGIVSHRTDVDL